MLNLLKFSFLLILIILSSAVHADQVLCGNNPNQDLRSQGADCYGKAQYERTIQILSRQVAKDPADGLSLARIAISYTKLGKHKEAIAAYKKAFDANWISYDVAYWYADSLYKSGNKEQAIIWNKRSIELAPTCLDCRKGLAEKLQGLNRAQEAVDLLQNYDDTEVAAGKPARFTGQIMLLKDSMNESTGIKN